MHPAQMERCVLLARPATFVLAPQPPPSRRLSSRIEATAARPATTALWALPNHWHARLEPSMDKQEWRMQQTVSLALMAHTAIYQVKPHADHAPHLRIPCKPAPQPVNAAVFIVRFSGQMGFAFARLRTNSTTNQEMCCQKQMARWIANQSRMRGAPPASVG